MSKLRIIVRTLVQSPLFTLTAVVSLALGIGANTAMFSMLDQVLLRRLAVHDPHELAFLYHPGPTQGSTSSDEPGGPSFSYPMMREMQQQQTAFTALAGRFQAAVSLSYRNSARPGSAYLVTGNYFSTLGVRPAVGRLFTEEDDRILSGHPVVVLNYLFWKNRFGEDVSMLNQTMVLNGYPMTIVGISQKGFTSERPGSTPDVFVPITMRREMSPDRDGTRNRQEYWITLFGRLKPGSTLEQAGAAINATYRDQLAQDLALLKNPDEDLRKRFAAKQIVLRPGEFGRGELRQESRTPLIMLFGMTLLVLLIACANVANLQLARAAARSRELAVRLALGASRRQLVQQLLTESCVIAVAGGILGLAVAQWTIMGILASLPERQATSGVITPDLDLRILLFCLALSVMTGIVFGLYPALHASGTDITGALKDQSGQATSTWAGYFRMGLVTMQLAISLLLLVSAALFGQTILNLARIDLGIETERLATFALNPRLNRYTSDRAAQFYQDLTERLSRVPGVALVAAARVPAVGGSTSSTNITVEGFTPQGDADTQSNYNEIGPGYFRTLGIPLVAGREFTPEDNQPNAPKTAIVNEAFVRRFFNGRQAIGGTIKRGGSSIAFDLTIVGVVKDSTYADPRAPVPPVFNVPYRLNTNLAALYFYVRTAVAPESLLPTIRTQVAALDPDLPIRDLRTMEAHLDSRMSREHLLSRLTGIFGVLAAVLAAIGLYGVLAFNIGRRTREIGIRIALGAKAGHVRGLIVREVALMVGIGTLLGMGGAFVVGKQVESVLYGVTAWHPWPYAAGAAALALIAFAAGYIPARRATNVDPLVALRCE